MNRKNSRLVYSTDPSFAKRCPRCHTSPCRCPQVRSLPPEEQTAHIRCEKKGRGGKTVTVVSNLQLTVDDLKALGKQLKQACGSGGTVKDGAIEIQGEHRDTLAVVLEEMGYKAKFTGG